MFVGACFVKIAGFAEAFVAVAHRPADLPTLPPIAARRQIVHPALALPPEAIRDLRSANKALVFHREAYTSAPVVVGMVVVGLG